MSKLSVGYMIGGLVACGMIRLGFPMSATVVGVLAGGTVISFLTSDAWS